MEPLRARKTNSWATRGPRQPSRPTHEIILISPFKGWSFRDRDNALESWVQSAVDKINDQKHGHVRLQWRRVRFNLADVFGEKRKRDSQLDSAVSTLKMFLPSRPAKNNSRKHDEAVTMLPLIFVTHSVGLWVMEDALANIAKSGIDPRPVVGVILLDGSPDGDVDVDFLNRLWGAMDIKAPKASRIKDLVDKFLSITAACKRVVPGEHLDTVNKSQQGSGWPWATKTFTVWVPDEANAQPTTQPRPVLWGMFRNRTSATPSEALNKISLRQAILSVTRAQIEATGDVSPPAQNPASVAESGKQTNQPLAINEGATVQTNRRPSATLTDMDTGLAVVKTNSPPSHQRWEPPSRLEIGPPRHLTHMSSDISHMGSQRTKGSNLAEDNASVISFPHVYSGESAPMGLKPVLALAQSFWTIGEFANAQALLERGLYLMETADPQDTSDIDNFNVLRFETRMHVAVIHLYRGEYDEAIRGLQALSADLDSLPEDDSATATNELKRWVAVSKLYRGDYFEAAEELEALSKGVREQEQVSKIQILRDLALANGLLGRHDDATRYILDAEELSNTQSLTEGDRAKSRWWSIQYTKACLDLFQGEYEAALEKVESAFRGLREKLGSAHLKTLRSATLGIQLLAKTGRYREAEMQCRKTMQITNHGLGRMHPLNLETIEGLVYILRSQSRLTEALETAKSLCAMAHEALHQMHPQVLRASSQLAATHLAIGNYHTAEKEIRRTVSFARECLGPNHPETLRYQSELAHVLSYYGDFVEARAIAIATLRDIILLAQTKGIETASGTDERIVDDVLDKIHSESPTDFFKPHPSLVFTLHVIALIEAKDPSGDLEQAERILLSVIWCRRRHLGPQHALTLLSEYDLACVVRDAGDSLRLSYVNNAFYHVWQERGLLFGLAHPETLSAEREVVITDCVRGFWQSGGPARRNQEHNPTGWRSDVPVDLAASESTIEHNTAPNLTMSQWIDVEDVSWAIFTLHESQLGPYHPETLKSLLWVFSIRFLLGKKSKNTELKEMWRDLRARLHHHSVRAERVAEVLRIEERVAVNFADEGDYDTGMAILRDVYNAASMYVQGDVTADLLETNRRSHPGLLAVLRTIVEDVEREIRDLEPFAEGRSTRPSRFDPAVPPTGLKSD
ncbi:hypothetical protein V8F20_009050 [Naviculisporaceae sp. PSN 640]